MTSFPAAPWSLALKIISALGTLVLLGVGIWTLGTHPHTPGLQATSMIVLGCVAWTILLLSALFVVRSYTLDGQRLRVQRLLWSTRVELQSVTEASDGSSLHQGTLRLFGSGGVLSFSGLFYNRRIGTYRAFITDWNRAVIVHAQPRPVVISPADPKAMMVALQAAFPQLAASNIADAS